MYITRFGNTERSGVTFAPEIANAPGRLILVSGPSGAGKGTVINELFSDPKIKAEVDRVKSITTRLPRPGEIPTFLERIVEGIKHFIHLCKQGFQRIFRPKSFIPTPFIPKSHQYDFITEDHFLKLKTAGQTFQWALYDKNYYGSTVQEVASKLKKGINVLFELASQDALAIKKLYGAKVMTVFIAPPQTEILEKADATSLEKELRALRDRLLKRGTNSEASIAERLKKAEPELALKPQFDEIIINENYQLEKAVAKLKELVTRKMTAVRFMGHGKRHIA